MRWSARVTEALCESKRQRLPFKFAWANAIQLHPFTPKEFGLSPLEAESLLEQSSHECFMWFRRICEMAYVDAPAPDGGPSRLRGLGAVLEMDLSALTDRHVPVRKKLRPPIAA